MIRVKPGRYPARFTLLSLCFTSFALPATAHGFVQDDVITLPPGDGEAIAEWRALAEKGDADAQYNLGQAYTIGQGVDRDLAMAEQWLAKAAKQGHVRAIESYGLILFRNNRQAEAMPYIQAAAARGEPRAQYILGIAHFNGDLAEQDWVLAYAYMLLAAEAGLPQADLNLATMDRHVPIEERQEGLRLARKIERDAKPIDGEQVVAVIQPETTTPVATQDSAVPDTARENIASQNQVAGTDGTAPERPAAATDTQTVSASPQEVVQPLPKENTDSSIVEAELPPSQVADTGVSQADIAAVDEPAQTEAADLGKAVGQELTQAEADGGQTDMPQNDAPAEGIIAHNSETEVAANDDTETVTEEQNISLTDADSPLPALPDTGSNADTVETDEETTEQVAQTEEPESAALVEEDAVKANERTASQNTDEAAPAIDPSQEVQQDNWRIQLGAFRTSEKVETAWQGLQARHAALAGLELYMQDAGEFKRLQVGPFTNRADAVRLCRNLENQPCFVVKSD